MKQTIICLVVLLSLTSCTGSSLLGKHNCSEREEVCIELRADEPIRYGEPVVITITLKSEKEFSDLGVSIYHDIGIGVEGPQGWEKDAVDAVIWESGVGWKTSVQANDSLTIVRKLSLPKREGIFQITARASTPSLHAADTIQIFMTQEGGKVYLSGSTIPITSGPLPTVDDILRATLHAIPTKSPYPTLTPAPPTESPRELSTPTGGAYPPPYP